MDVRTRLAAGPVDARWDAVVVALQPARRPALGARRTRELLAERAPGTLVAQYWGDVDRDALRRRRRARVAAAAAPRRAHGDPARRRSGPEPIVRLQAGGLKVGEVLCRADAPRPATSTYVDPV